MGSERKATSWTLRVRDGAEARVTYEELFFDLVYVFAVTQISHYLLGHLQLMGALQALLLWFAVWLGWQYTAWVTNWFEPRALPIRLMLFGVMLAGLFMSAAIPGAFAERGWTFALAIVAIQAGRSLYVLALLRGHELARNFRRILGWNLIAAVFWLAGAASEPSLRLAWWALAVACEYVSPMFGFALPGLGRSSTRDWTIEGGHFAERCQLFVMMALGESVLLVGETFTHTETLLAASTPAFLTGFLTCIGMWWLYFDTSSSDGSHVLAHAEDPGRLAARFHYVHVLIVGAIIVAAVGNELLIAHPAGHLELAALAVTIGAPVAYYVGNGLYKRIVYGAFPASHAAGIVATLLLLAAASSLDLLGLNVATTVILLAVAVWDTRRRRAARAHA